MNGFLFTKDGKLICELAEPIKISYEPYKDKRTIKVQCRIMDWRNRKDILYKNVGKD